MYDLSLFTPFFCLLRDTLRLRQATFNVLYAFGVWVFMSGVVCIYVGGLGIRNWSKVHGEIKRGDF